MNRCISENIKQLREAKKMTQSDLAERVGVTSATISSYEVGTRMPSFDVLIKIAKLFHVSTDNLLGLDQKLVFDVSELTTQQRAAIQEIILLFQEQNDK